MVELWLDAAEPGVLAAELAAELADEDDVLTFTRPDEVELTAEVTADADVAALDAVAAADPEVVATADYPAAEVEEVVDESHEGAATAVLGSVSAPVPQGIACPSGCVALGGETVEPSAPARAKRVVQVRFWPSAENW